MQEACRTCLGLINVENSPFFEIEADDMQLSAESCRHKLLSIVPEMALNITPKSMLCAECHRSLVASFEFKKKCLKTENILEQFIQTKLDLDIKKLDLKDVSAFNAVDIAISEDKSFEMFVDEVTVKEEVELYDTAIVKQEADDFSLKNVEIAQAKNAVPGFLADINISEEEVAEASFQDVVVTKEVESYDPVITNVKDEVVNLYQSKKCTKVGTYNPPQIHTGKPSKIRKKTYCCEICNCRFVRKYHLEMHLRTHTGEKPYRCDTCNRCFAHKSNLTSHLRKHTGEKPYCCDTCHRRFAYHSHLNTHLIMHTGKQPYVCTVCGKGFPTNSKLTLHNRVHTGEKPYLCNICAKRFTLKYSLTVHMRSHTGERPYRCELCDRSFKRKSNLLAHRCVHGRRSAARDPLQD